MNRAFLRRHRGSLLFVALPTLLAMLHYFVIAADLYAAEARFVVRSPGKPTMSGLAALLPTAAAGGSEDAYAVQNYATSRDAMTALAGRLDLRALFARPEADVFSRFPNPLDWDNAEDFHRYYQRRVTVVYDTTSGISTLTVKAFRPEDAEAVANQLLDLGEGLVNRLNARARGNAVRDAEADVEQARQALARSQQGLLEYRNRESLLDPARTSGAVFESQARAEAELANARTRLSELLRATPQSPLRSDLEARIAALEQQLERQRSRLTGGEQALAPKLSTYEQLSLDKDFAGKALASALASLESARAEARRQQTYLERVVAVSRPERAEYPQRGRAVLIVFITAFLMYSIASLLIAGVREHGQQ